MIVNKLGDIMRQKGYTNKQVVDLTGVSRNTIKGFESNASKRIDYDTLDRLCSGLDVSPADILVHIKKNES
ncbi:helix-turn-helix transcriptional regulator [Alkalihalobacillus sp. LMS6]|uniref:helix-turn-helix domain-containing protein n=1 Tax=Alkalihalobacillus sp. LMS6 TaxID=2924034 RepID=UPI0020D19FC2|nr:helix-turn-helix transcriptional regulator [Alkalihalobacillus sp. LMS6]UTR07709.1 helix-turn-helix transcriptional regulator [Alkalihalobacillus sp. LMS6]